MIWRRPPIVLATAFVHGSNGTLQCQSELRVSQPSPCTQTPLRPPSISRRGNRQVFDPGPQECSHLSNAREWARAESSLLRGTPRFPSRGESGTISGGGG